MAGPKSVRPHRSSRPARAAHSRPPGAGPIALRLIVRSRGGRGAGMLEALLEGVTARQLEDMRAAYGSSDLLARATKIIVQADHMLHSAAPAQRVALRGFSEAMLAVAADQTCRLAHLQEERDRALQEDEATKQGLERAMLRADALVAQAIRILKKVCAAGEERACALEILGKPDEAGERAVELAAALLRVADEAERIVGEGSSSLQRRAALYGLDATYLEDLKQASERLSDLHVKVRDKGRRHAAVQALDRDHAVVAFLVHQIVEAFDAARAIDPSIPALSRADTEPPRGAGKAH